MDLATRAVKLLFLQIVAPIPIISYMDVGKGQDIFKKWGKECINTYLSVFIRLIAINFAVFMIVLVRGNYKDVFVNNVWLNIFLIIGCLMFAKQIPHLIEEFLGIKLNGLSLKPLKKFKEQALFGTQIAGIGEKTVKKTAGVALGGAVGVGAGLRAAGANILAPGKGGRIFGSAAGFASAFNRSLLAGFKGEKAGKIFTNSYNAAMESKERRMDKDVDGVNNREILKNRIQRAIHQKTRGQRADELDKSIESYISKGEQVKNAIYANDKAAFNFLDSNGQMHSFKGAKGLKEYIDNMQAPVQGATESIIDFGKRQEEFLAFKQEFVDELDRQVSDITTGSRNIDDGAGGGSGGAAAQAAISKILESMDEQLELINDEGDDLYGGDFKPIDSARKVASNHMSMKNSLGGAKGAQTTIISAAGHDRDVDKYATKKDK